MYNELIANLRNCAEMNSLSWYKRGLIKQATEAVSMIWIVNTGGVSMMLCTGCRYQSRRRRNE